MVATAGYRARIYNGDFSLAAKLTDVSTNLEVDMLDKTTFADTAKRFLPGQDTSTLSASGFVDAAVNTDNAAWTDAQPFTYCPQGSAVGQPAVMVNALKSSYEVGTQVAAVAAFSIAGQADGPTSFGVSLHDEGAETADGSAASVDNAAATTAGGVAHLHVSAFSGFSGAVVTVEDSATGSSGWVAIATFATVAAATSERVTIAGTIRRYTRCTIDVTGSGSTTYACFLARN